MTRVDPDKRRESPSFLSLVDLREESGLLADNIGPSADHELRLLTDVVQALPVGVVAIDAHGQVLLGNDFIREFTSTMDGPLEDLPLWHPDGRMYSDAERPILIALRTGERVVGRELVVLDTLGRRRHLLANAVPVVDDGAVRFVVAAYFDITAQKEAERRAERDRRRQDALLHTLRSSLLPPHLPAMPGANLAATFHAATDDIGGDFYDAFPLRGQSFGVVVGDVCGQGPEAAVVTSLIRYTLRGAAMTTRRPADALGLVNEALLANDTDRFCTAVFARVRPWRGHLEVAIARAGHPYPLVRRQDGSVTPVRDGGALLGVVDHLEIREEHIVLSPGDMLVMVTDGVTEAVDDAGEELGWEGVAEIVRRLPLEATPDEVVERLLAATVGDGAADDVAAVVVQARCAN